MRFKTEYVENGMRYQTKLRAFITIKYFIGIK